MTKESSVFFPERMQHVELIVPLESAAVTIKMLAEKDIIHLVDQNPGTQSVNKRYTDIYLRCEEAERDIDFISAELERYELLPEPITLEQYQQHIRENPVNLTDRIDAVKQAAASLHDRIQRTQQLESQQNVAKTTLEALRFFRPLLHERRSQVGMDSDNDHSSIMEMELLGGSSFLFSITGVVESTKMRKLLFTFYRISRGNVVTTTGVCDSDPSKTFFTTWFQSETIQRKLCNIASSFGADVFEFPVDDAGLDRRENELTNQIAEGETVLRQSFADNRAFLETCRSAVWLDRLFFLSEKSVFEKVDFADFGTVADRAIFRGWVAERRVSELQPLLETAMEAAGCPVHTTIQLDNVDEMPPTWIETNEFTMPFQMFNDAYGYANYDEVNGGAFYAMYPFLFGVMFGDVGHAFIYLLVALALVFGAPALRRMKNGLAEMALSFRWFLLIMSLCGVYCGFVYNECFGLPLDLFGSHWRPGTSIGSKVIYERTDSNVYPIGVDPVWMFKDNELVMLNSLKMKLSVVMGVTQMVFGMILALIKHVRRGHIGEIFMEWLPQILYLGSFFCYMVGIIILKWLTDASQTQNPDGVNLIQVLIGMILSPFDLDPALELYPHQKITQNILILIFVATIPALLFVKPLVEICRKGPKNLIEIFVMNLIDVIEFCLSALSHTASYLRLWALSLAHSQLSHVLWDELFVLTLKSKNPALLFVGWAGYAAGSVVILLGMECFSSLLHAIRLMWVEFSSKFYTGQGYPFQPLSLAAAAEEIGVKKN